MRLNPCDPNSILVAKEKKGIIYDKVAHVECTWDTFSKLFEKS
jgi:hypothetical protein